MNHQLYSLHETNHLLVYNGCTIIYLPLSIHLSQLVGLPMAAAPTKQKFDQCKRCVLFYLGWNRFNRLVIVVILLLLKLCMKISLWVFVLSFYNCFTTALYTSGDARISRLGLLKCHSLILVVFNLGWCLTVSRPLHRLPSAWEARSVKSCYIILAVIYCHAL